MRDCGIIENDMFSAGSEVEIGIDRDGRRWTLVCFAEDSDETKHLESDDVWLVSGGGSGVTAASIIV